MQNLSLCKYCGHLAYETFCSDLCARRYDLKQQALHAPPITPKDENPRAVAIYNLLSVAKEYYQCPEDDTERCNGDVNRMCNPCLHPDGYEHLENWVKTASLSEILDEKERIDEEYYV